MPSMIGGCCWCFRDWAVVRNGAPGSIVIRSWPGGFPGITPHKARDVEL